jgi:PPOX class probable F420-dependent enzyme
MCDRMNQEPPSRGCFPHPAPLSGGEGIRFDILSLRRRLVFIFLALLIGVIGAEAKQPPAAAAGARPTMTPQQMQAFLARPLVAHLAIVRANRTPQLVPMWFLYENGVIYMSTRVNAAKLAHIRANPHVAVVIDVTEAPLKNKVVTLEGIAEIQTTGVKETVTRIYQKYLGPDAVKSPAARHNINEPRVILKITPKRIHTMDTTR